MISRTTTFGWLLGACVLLGLVGWVEVVRPAWAAQQPGMLDDHVANDVPPGARPAIDRADEPAGPKLPNDPAVLAVLDFKPRSAVELVRAIKALVDLGHAPLAKDYVEQLQTLDLDPAGKSELVDRFNSATLMKLARQREFEATLAPFIDDVFQSAAAFRRDPARLAESAESLAEPDLAVRAQAIQVLMGAGEAAVGPLVKILADPSRAQMHAVVMRVLVGLSDTAVSPLLGVLESPNDDLKVRAIAALGQIRSQRAVTFLLASAASARVSPAIQSAARRALFSILGRLPDATEASWMLEQAVEHRLQESLAPQPPDDSPTVIWHWNARRRLSVPVEYNGMAGKLVEASRLAWDHYQLNPASPASRRLYLIALLQATKFRVGLDKPLPAGQNTTYEIVARTGAAEVDGLLAYALRQGYAPAATAAVEVLGDIGTPASLARGGEPSPLAMAANSADPRLRFAGIEAVLKLRPTEPFAGSSHVFEGLARLAQSEGAPRALIVHPRRAEGQTVGGLAASLDYDADVATNGRDAFRLATDSADYDFIMIHSAIDRFPVDELLSQLRRDPRTANIPVGLMAPIEDFDRVQRFAVRSKAEVFLQPQNSAEMALFAKNLWARAGNYRLTNEERDSQRRTALAWLIAICERPSGLFEVRRYESIVQRALDAPELSGRAAEVLGQIGTPQGQRTLLDVAGQSWQDLAMRRAAVNAFGRSVRRYGNLLSRDEILRQYDSYNASAGLDKDTQSVLASILDAIERKNDLPRQ